MADAQKRPKKKQANKTPSLVSLSEMATPIKTGRKKSTENTTEIAAQKEPERCRANCNRWNAPGEI